MVLTRSTARADRRTTLRRSTRLNGAMDGLERPLMRSKTATSSKRRSVKKVKDNHDADGNNEDQEVTSCGTRSQRVARLEDPESDLLQRSRDIIKAEKDISAQWELLEQREQEMVYMQLKKDAQAALQQLEEHFQCPLCYEIMANPYTLTPAECGHTFCALCTLKWFFSRLHRSCGSWHESVDCPVCRSLLILTPDATPRTLVTVPFTPNRLARKVIDALLKKLEINLGSQATERSGKAREMSCRRSNGCTGKRVKSESRTPGLLKTGADGLSTLDSWALDGELRRDWRERDKLGRKEMDDILTQWCNLGAQEFVMIKRRLGV